MNGRLLAVCISDRRGVQKRNVGRGKLVVGHGIEGDAHAGDWHRQVSLLAQESADWMRERGADIAPGAFGENLLTEGIDLKSLPIGTIINVGNSVRLRVTQIGKECHDRCAIYKLVGDCVMPREGIFAEVLQGGEVAVGDSVEVVSPGDRAADVVGDS
ncbi:MAG TPA: MOSC domain-containing protein [Planctomycetaceae bacterium]|nr:MOSC domain-containing protein [Planctomycetaceae bacterium]